MPSQVEYSIRERIALWIVGAFGFLIINGAFLYGLFLDPGALNSALLNPISAAFILEALVLVGVFAYLFSKWGVARLSWRWFVVLSLLGSMAFSVPVILLWGRRSSPPAE